MREADIQRDIRLRLGQMDDVVLWRNNTGVAKIGKRYVPFGLVKGSADTIGIVTMPTPHPATILDVKITGPDADYVIQLLEKLSYFPN